MKSLCQKVHLADMINAWTAKETSLNTYEGNVVFLTFARQARVIG